jgi:hypothetical protein
MGFRLNVPIGFRDAHALARSARLNLYRSYYQLKDTEDKARRFLGLQYRNVVQYYEEFGAQHAQREANAAQLKARFEAFQAGTVQGTIDVLLEAQRNWADALSSEYTAIVNYNNALAGFQFAKGTILNYDNVAIAEGPLPQCVQVRAIEHIREREKALIFRERPDPAVYDAQIRGDCAPAADAPANLVNVPVIQTAPPTSDPTAPPAGLPTAPVVPASGTIPLTPPGQPGGPITPAPLVPLHKDP